VATLRFHVRARAELITSDLAIVFAGEGMRSTNLRVVSAAALGAAICVGCYQTTSLRLEVKSPSTNLDCVATADRVFSEAGFERIRTMRGPDMFYTPRTTASSDLALRWGIGAWLNRDNPGGTCDVSLEAMSEDPGPPVSNISTGQAGNPFIQPVPGPPLDKAYSSQAGHDYDSAVREMAKRLEVAFGGSAATP
jgi:hypothetical protein